MRPHDNTMHLKKFRTVSTCSEVPNRLHGYIQGQSGNDFPVFKRFRPRIIKVAAQLPNRGPKAVPRVFTSTV